MSERFNKILSDLEKIEKEIHSSGLDHFLDYDDEDFFNRFVYKVRAIIKRHGGREE